MMIQDMEDRGKMADFDALNGIGLVSSDHPSRLGDQDTDTTSFSCYFVRHTVRSSTRINLFWVFRFEMSVPCVLHGNEPDNISLFSREKPLCTLPSAFPS